MESRESTEPNAEDREEGTPQGQLTGEEPGASSGPAEEEGGADSVSDAAGEGG